MHGTRLINEKVFTKDYRPHRLRFKVFDPENFKLYPHHFGTKLLMEHDLRLVIRISNSEVTDSMKNGTII
jgi:hypothetical protein